MRPVYLLLLLLMCQTYSGSAQVVKNLDLRVLTIYGATEQTRKIMSSGDSVHINVWTYYYWGWQVINNGPDSTEYGDTIRILSGLGAQGPFLAKPFSLVVEPRIGAGSVTNPELPNLRAGDTGYYVPIDNRVAYSTLDPHGSKFRNHTDTSLVWCDTVWCVAGQGNKAVNESNPVDNVSCETITAIFKLVGIDGVELPSTDVFVLFPNPATNSISLKHTFDPMQEASINILDITGRVVHRQELGKLNGTLDVPVDLPLTLAKGVYIMQLKEGEKVMSERFNVN